MAVGRELRLGIVAGEVSGDRLGAALLHALGERGVVPAAFGMAGAAMRAAGCEPLARAEELSVMGLVEVVQAYPRLWSLRQRLGDALFAARPDVVVGIDVPDFTLGLERRLKLAGVPTVHWVCPQAWAWREGRAADIRTAVDRLLALFPFEVEFFSRRGIATEFVGHPLADQLPLEPQRAAARQALALAGDRPVLALMPGSRSQELAQLLSLFISAARIVHGCRPGMQVIVCTINEEHARRVREALGGLPAGVYVGNSQQVLTAADVVLAASGTVTLEALLCGTPMVVGYRMAPLSYHIIRRMVKIPRIALPNILAARDLVPELLQSALTPAALAEAALAWFDQPDRRDDFVRTSRELHASLRRDAAGRAAEAVLRVAGVSG
ncbi:MAG: lipid-A-disaccharide synthase [Gammaproteobacteria bacterium]